ncbi:MAG: hypothetical protein ACYC6N_18790 [Pirellulaceae bacterium]
MSLRVEDWFGMKVKLLSSGSRRAQASPLIEQPRGFVAASGAEEREWIEHAQQQRQHVTTEQTEAAAVNKAHTIIGMVALTCMCVGAGIEWGTGYSCLIAGGLLLAGVVYARTRPTPGIGGSSSGSP